VDNCAHADKFKWFSVCADDNTSCKTPLSAKFLKLPSKLMKVLREQRAKQTQKISIKFTKKHITDERLTLKHTIDSQMQQIVATSSC
jgi:hypothetical protein